MGTPGVGVAWRDTGRLRGPGTLEGDTETDGDLGGDTGSA